MNMPHNHYTHEYVESEHAIFFARGREIVITIEQEEHEKNRLIVSWEKHFIAWMH